MPKRQSHSARMPVSARCDAERGSFPAELFDLTSDGCIAQASAKWDEDDDFVHLRIADRVDINGKVLWRRGGRVGIGFFGQIHPQVVNDLRGAIRAAA